MSLSHVRIIIWISSFLTADHGDEQKHRVDLRVPAWDSFAASSMAQSLVHRRASIVRSWSVYSRAARFCREFPLCPLRLLGTPLLPCYLTVPASQQVWQLQVTLILYGFMLFSDPRSVTGGFNLFVLFVCPRVHPETLVTHRKRSSPYLDKYLTYCTVQLSSRQMARRRGIYKISFSLLLK